jgi:hypothetical protein
MNIITPMKLLRNLRQKIDYLKTQGIEPNVENLNKEFMTEFIAKIKEQNNE